MNYTIPMNHNLHHVLNLIHQAEGLKTLLRHSWLSTGRQESVAEHTWRMSLMAVLLHKHLKDDIDLGHTLKLIAVHDLPEIKAGDHHAFKEKPTNKPEKEQKALKDLTQLLDSHLKDQIINLWQEFEAGETPEAKFAQALDKLEVLIQHNQADIKTWDEREYDFNFTYGDKETAHDPTLKKLRQLIKQNCQTKIKQES